jgi:hypothetical protein
MIYNLHLSFPELSQHGPILFDPYCKEPIVWGYKINRHESSWDLIRNPQTFEMIRSLKDKYFLVTGRLSPRKAAEKYGPFTGRQIDCGHWRSITYGHTTFASPCMEINKRLLQDDWLDNVIRTAEMFDYPDDDLIDEDEMECKEDNMEYELDE